jgi:stress-induced morphogen
MKEILLTVDAEGTVKVETKGFKGKSCIKESEFLENALGKELKRQLTPAYYEEEKHYLNLCG